MLEFFHMKPFDYILVLVSLIIGVAATDLFESIGTIIKTWHRSTDDVLRLIWILNAMLLLISYWWAIYNDRSQGVWSITAFLFYFLQPAILSVICVLLKPEATGDTAPMTALSESVRFPFFMLLASIPLLTVTIPVVVRHRTFSLGQTVVAVFVAGMMVIFEFQPKYDLPWGLLCFTGLTVFLFFQHDPIGKEIADSVAAKNLRPSGSHTD